MPNDSKPAINCGKGRKCPMRGGAIFLAVALVLGGVLLLVDLEEEHVDSNQPASGEIADAVKILSESMDDEQALVTKLQALHSRLDKAIDLLGKAEQLAPEDKRQIETLRVRLRALEDSDRMLSTNPGAVKQAYQDLTDQLNRLAQKLAKPAS